jgi:two-component system cell cycle response regulator
MSSLPSPPGGPVSTVRPPTALRVLVVDDDETLRRLITRWLEQSGMQVVQVGSGEDAIAAVTAEADRIDGIVLDVMLPGMDGFTVLTTIRALPAGDAIPVLLLTAHANEDNDVLRGLGAGAFDHMAKPFSGALLAAKMVSLCERSRGERDLRRRLARAERTAAIDALTGLRNRRAFETRLREETAYAKRHAEPFALVVVDLDHFKVINDTFGHEEGDRVLVHFARTMEELLRTEDAAFRYGGEEFILLFRGSTADNAAVAVNRLRNALAARPITLGEPPETRTITFSAGVAAARADEQFAGENLVERADDALYRAKRAGRDRVEVAGD